MREFAKRKKMKTTKFALWRRAFAIVMVVMMLLSALTACGRQAVVKPTFNDAALDNLEGCGLKREELRMIANMLISVYDVNYDTQEMLIAAYRGYDMVDKENFDDSKVDPSAKLDPNMSVVIKLIDQANQKAKDAKTETYVTFTDYSERMNPADVLVLINSMKTTVTLEEGKGFWGTILGGIGWFIGWMTNTLCFGSYIGGICLFAVIVEILMLPLSIKQQKNSIKQAKLRPKEMAIRKKYAGRDDPVTKQKMGQEMQELYRKENVSMAGGCLPLLIQMPILIALYRIVIDPLRYVLGQVPALSSALATYATTARAAGGLGLSINASNGTIGLLSNLGSEHLEGLGNFMFFNNGQSVAERVESIIDKIPDFTLGNVNLGANPGFDGNYILLLIPVLTFVVYFLSMRLTKKFTYQPQAMQDQQTACSGWIMDIYMPGMSTVFAFMVPALVGIYWMFKSVISTLRQFIVCKIMPYPQFTEEDYRAAEREYAGKAPRKGENRPDNRTYTGNVEMVGGKPKSLFHMDDDDYLAQVEAEAKKDELEDTPEADAKLDGVTLKAEDKPGRDKKNKKTSDEQTDASDNER